MIIIATILGNLLVCVTITTNRKLRNYTNHFILSLATTDLLLGLLVLPFSAVSTLSDHWPLGAIFCNIYISFDVMFCTVSILTLFVISLDRYFAVNMPLRYQQRMSFKQVWKINAAIWIFSLAMAFLPIHLGWNTTDGSVQNMGKPLTCIFELNKPYVLLVAVATYFAPLVIMCGVYLKVLQITRKQVKEINRLSKAGSGLAKAMLALEENGEGLAGTSSKHKRELKQKHHKEHKIVSDRKATVTLASVVIAFAICWIPYFILFTIKAFIHHPVSVHLDLFVLWLGYVNSSVNPFLYAFYNSSFRDAFKKVLCQRCPDQQVKMAFLNVKPKSPRLGDNSDTSELSALRNAIC
jgi:histamine receptor H2